MTLLKLTLLKIRNDDHSACEARGAYTTVSSHHALRASNALESSLSFSIK